MAVAKQKRGAVREDLAAIRGEAEKAIALAAKRYSTQLKKRLDADEKLDRAKRTVDTKFMKEVLNELCDFWNVDLVSIATEVSVDRSTLFRWKAGTTKPKQYACIALIRGFLGALEKHHGVKP